MIKVVLGILFGFTATIWYVALDLKFDFNHSLSVNIVIAMATIVATAIHFDSQTKLRKDRIWDTNKAVLLELAHALSEVIEATEDEIHNFHCQFEDDEKIEVKPYVFKKIKDKVDYALTVYRPLMDKSLIAAIQQHNKQDKEIAHQVKYEDLDHLDAYETMLSEHKKLYNELLEFMGKISGVKNT
ncbi:hypothetical protein [Aeromonas salmonicida]|uniref:hypothetical protein n=1 Tax=Aeromonas salmonicida TaxID=645 RepID=UPI00223FA0D3|nr:hypothetical protein [Aeromonas salmonicida]